jgi:uncharacterized protein DUF6880
MDGLIEDALEPGNFIPYHEGYAFVGDLEAVEGKIASVVAKDPARAVALYETFLAGCNEKAEEIDDSDGGFGTFAGGLFLGWIKARQASGADAGETVKLLLKWMEDDQYGFCNDLQISALKALDRAGCEAFERQIRARFDEECAALHDRKRRAEGNPNYHRDHWGGILKAIYSHRRNVGRYVEVTEKSGLTPADCEVIATMLQARRKLDDALGWVERGMAIDPRNNFGRGYSYKLGEMRRALLVKLGRGGEALDSAWDEFQAQPGKFTYDELIRYVPKARRRDWHEKAMAASEQGDLDSVTELLLGVKEIGRLAARLDRESDAQLESLSHYTTEPAAQRLSNSHPALAARLFRAMCIRILAAGKSKYYSAALSNIGKAKACYEKAGLDAQWQALAAEIRRDHHRKPGFMPGFERILRGSKTSAEPSFLDLAKRRWASRFKA